MSFNLHKSRFIFILILCLNVFRAQSISFETGDENKTSTETPCSILATTFSVINPTCYGDCNGSTVIGISGTGTPPYSISGSFTSSPVTTFSSTATLTGFCNGFFLLTITDGMGCIGYVGVSFTQPPVITFSATTTGSTAACDGTISVSASGGTGAFTYSKDGGATYQGSSMFTGLCAGSYSICVKDANGCVKCSTYTVSSIASCAVVATVLSSTPVTCYGVCNGTAIIAATGGTAPYVATGAFPPVTFSGVGTLTNLCPGTNSVLVTDALGCLYTLIVTTPTPPPITFSATTTTSSGLCDGTISVSATGGTGAITYSKDGGATYQSSSMFTGLCAGTYNICVMDANGCVQCANYTVANSCAMVATIFSPTSVSCFGVCDGTAIVMATAGTAPYTVTGPGPTMTFTSSTTVTGLCGGANTLLVTDAIGCTYPLTIFISSPTAIVVGESHVNPSSGASSDGSITLNATGGTPGYQYSVDGGVTLSPSPNFTGLPCGTYNCSVYDMNGCIGTITVTLTCGCGMVATVFGMTSTTCFGTCDGTAQVAATLGMPPYIVSGMGITTTTFASSTTLTGLCAGSYVAVVTDAGGCNYTLTFTISQPTAITSGAIISPATSGCNGSISISTIGGTSPYQWSVDGGITWNSSSVFNSLCAGTYNMCAMDVNGCVACLTLVVPGCTLSSTVITSTPASCNGLCDGAVVISTTGGTMPYIATIGTATYTYSGVLTAINLCAGTNIAFISDAGGCTSAFTFVITEPTPIITTISVGSNPTSFAACDGVINGAATGGTPSYTYQWLNCSTGVTTGSTSPPPASGFCAGNFAFIATDQNGCADTSNCVTLTAPSGINDLQNDLFFTIYPNPCSNFLTVSTDAAGEYDVILTNVLGEVIISSKLKRKLVIDLKELNINEGIYFVVVKDKLTIKTRKIVYQH